MNAFHWLDLLSLLPLLQFGVMFFVNAPSIIGIEIPTTVTKIVEGTFFECTSLQNVTFLSSIKEINMFAFYWCCSLCFVHIPHSVSVIQVDAFTNCATLVQMIIPSDTKCVKNSIDNHVEIQNT